MGFEIVGFGAGSGLDSRGRFRFRQSSSVFCRVCRNMLLTNWGSGLVQVFFEKSGSGFRKSGPGWVFRNPLSLVQLQMCVCFELLNDRING